MADTFNGLDELLSRSDCGTVILDKYQKCKIPKRKQLDYDKLVDKDTYDVDLRKIINDETMSRKLDKDLAVQFNIDLSEALLATDGVFDTLSYDEKLEVTDAVAEKEKAKTESEYYENTTTIFYQMVFDEDNDSKWLEFGMRREQSEDVEKAASVGYTTMTLYTPTGKRVTVKRWAKASNVSASKAAQLIKTYPSAKIYENGTYGYNCHGFVWLYNNQYYHDIRKRVDMPSASGFSSDPYYTKESYPTRKYEIAYWGTGQHSGVVWQTSYSFRDKNDKVITGPYVKSKWGLGGPLAMHSVYDCPYSQNKENEQIFYYFK